MANRYDIIHDPYIDPKTGILRNKICAHTQAELDTAEAEITYVIIATLSHGSSVNELVFEAILLLEIHKEIFHDIYRWAGKIRTQDISKESGYFAHAEFITGELDRISRELHADFELREGSRPFVVKRLAYYYGEFNAVHPFREGNGRAIRTFLRLLALSIGYDIDWQRIEVGENIAACKAAMRADYHGLEAMLDKLVVTIDHTKFNPKQL